MGGIALELLVEQVKCYVSTNHFFLSERSKSQDISCLFAKGLIHLTLMKNKSFYMVHSLIHLTVVHEDYDTMKVVFWLYEAKQLYKSWVGF